MDKGRGELRLQEREQESSAETSQEYTAKDLGMIFSHFIPWGDRERFVQAILSVADANLKGEKDAIPYLREAKGGGRVYDNKSWSRINNLELSRERLTVMLTAYIGGEDIPTKSVQRIFTYCTQGASEELQGIFQDAAERYGRVKDILRSIGEIQKNTSRINSGPRLRHAEQLLRSSDIRGRYAPEAVQYVTHIFEGNTQQEQMYDPKIFAQIHELLLFVMQESKRRVLVDEADARKHGAAFLPSALRPKTRRFDPGDQGEGNE